MRLRISKLAYSDLDSIYAQTISRWGQEQADLYLHALWDALEKVAAAPERWRPRTQAMRRKRPNSSRRAIASA